MTPTDRRGTRPRRPSVCVARPDVTNAIECALHSHSVAFLFGPAGSGKSLAVDEFARDRGVRADWLDVRGPPDGVTDCLGEAAPGDLVVADGLDQLDVEEQDALDSALRRRPAGVHTIITSRLAPPSGMARARLDGRVHVIDPGILVLDLGQAVELVEAHGIGAKTAAGIHEDCGGWVAGVILEARALSSAVDRDALDAYVATEILTTLSPSLRSALACTADLDWVSERLLVELADGQPVAAELLRVPLPGCLTHGGLQLAPCVRRVVRATIERSAARRACARAAWTLRAKGASADAADALISAGHLLAAEAPAADAATKGIEDARVLGWLGALDVGAARRRASLREAELRALSRRGKPAAVALRARAMRADGELDGLLARGEPAASWAVASLVRGGHGADALALLDAAEHPIWAPAAWALSVLCRPDPTPPPLDVGAAATLPLACLVAEALLWRGRPADAAALLELAESHDPAITLERARQLLALGDVEGGRALAATEGVHSVAPERAAALECELAVARGEPDRALALLPAARTAAERAGDVVTARIDLAVVESHALWLSGAPRRAVPTLSEARSWAHGRGLRAAVEWVDVWLGGATLAAGSAPAARSRLERSVGSMTNARRQLARPFGSIVLAEARWEEGDEAGHDEAVDEALRSAFQCGGRLMLRFAARLVPQPLARRDRGSATSGIQRRLLDLAIAAADVAPPDAHKPVVRLRTLGCSSLEAIPDGHPLTGTRGIVELLAYLVAQGGAAPLEDVLADVMPSSVGIAFVKRTARTAQKLLPDTVSLELSSSWLRIQPAGAIRSDDGELMGLAGAVALARGQRAEELRSAVRALAADGPYLPGVDARWACARREEVARAVSDCLASGADPAGSEVREDEFAGASQLVPTRRLMVRHALAKGVPPATPTARDDLTWRLRPPATR